MTSRDAAPPARDPFNDEGDLGTKNYNRKEVLWKTENLPIKAVKSAI
jgi:hypothetical protein